MKNKTVQFSVFALLIGAVPISVQAIGFNDCYAVAKNYFNNQSEAVKTCSKAGQGFNDCYAVAKYYFNKSNN